jgi:uncharacterized protein
MEKNVIDWIALVLVIIGGLNWGLYGLFSIDLVSALLGSIPILATIVYTLVGIAALWIIYFAFKN